MPSTPKVQLKRLSHITYSHKNPEWTCQFLKDFGFQEVESRKDKTFFRGYGDLPYIYVAEKAPLGKPQFKGVAFEAETEEDLVKASKLPVRTLSSM